MTLIVAGVSSGSVAYDATNYDSYDYNHDYDYIPTNCHWEYSGSNQTYICCDYDVNGTYNCKPDPYGPPVRMDDSMPWIPDPSEKREV